MASRELREGEYRLACVVQHMPHPGDSVRGGPPEQLLFLVRRGAASRRVRVEDGVMEQDFTRLHGAIMYINYGTFFDI